MNPYQLLKINHEDTVRLLEENPGKVAVLHEGKLYLVDKKFMEQEVGWRPRADDHRMHEMIELLDRGWKSYLLGKIPIDFIIRDFYADDGVHEISYIPYKEGYKSCYIETVKTLSAQHVSSKVARYRARILRTLSARHRRIK